MGDVDRDLGVAVSADGRSAALRAEEWRDTPVSADYWVSSFGRVLSRKTHRIMSPVHNGDGYLTVRLAGTRHYIHRLVCRAFHGEPQDGQQVAHLNGDRSDNDATNLAWVSGKQNNAHKKEHGTHQAGEKHPRARLTADQVASIRSSTETHNQLAAQFGVNESAIRKIRKGERWIV